MIIDMNSVNNDTKKQYELLQKQVADLVQKYQKNDGERFSKIIEKVEQTNGEWDSGITLIDGNTTTEIPILQVMAYEYCLATEIITNGNVSLDQMAENVFSKVSKFRIGNPILGIDDVCLYGKTHEDETAMPVTSKLYKMVSNSGAQHSGYFQGGKLRGAVFLLEEEEIPKFAVDENGNDVGYTTEGIPYKNLPTYMTLLTYFRQTAFHELNHEAENDIIDAQNPILDEVYKSVDGKKYRNYQKITKYLTGEHLGQYKEPQYVISTQKDEHGEQKYFYIEASSGKLRPLDEVRFSFGKAVNIENNPILTSSGMTTIEIISDKETKMHNQVSEGFVEAIARAMVYAIAPETKDLDEGRYFEKVEMAKKVIESRDTSLGENGKGRTYTDFLTHSAILKKELESREVTRTDGSKVDGLHYISDYADSVYDRVTPKRQKYKMIVDAIELGVLDKKIAGGLKQLDVLSKKSLTKDEITTLKILLRRGGLELRPTEKFVNDFIRCMQEESDFFDGIPEKLGYREREIENENENDNDKDKPKPKRKMEDIRDWVDGRKFDRSDDF